MNARGLCPVVLEEIEVGIPAFVKRDNLTMNDRVVREVREGLEN